MTRKQQAGGKDEPNGAGGSNSKTDSLETQLKNVDINKVRVDGKKAVIICYYMHGA